MPLEYFVFFLKKFIILKLIFLPFFILDTLKKNHCVYPEVFVSLCKNNSYFSISSLHKLLFILELISLFLTSFVFIFVFIELL